MTTYNKGMVSQGMGGIMHRSFAPTILAYKLPDSIPTAEDKCFVFFLPEFKDVMQPFTNGDSYDEAISNAQALIELLTESYTEEGETLPQTETVSSCINQISIEQVF